MGVTLSSERHKGARSRHPSSGRSRSAFSCAPPQKSFQAWTPRASARDTRVARSRRACRRHTFGAGSAPPFHKIPFFKGRSGGPGLC